MNRIKIDFDALLKEFETAILGRKTPELLIKQGGNGALPGLDVVVFQPKPFRRPSVLASGSSTTMLLTSWRL